MRVNRFGRGGDIRGDSGDRLGILGRARSGRIGLLRSRRRRDLGLRARHILLLLGIPYGIL